MNLKLATTTETEHMPRPAPRENGHGHGHAHEWRGWPPSPVVVFGLLFSVIGALTSTLVWVSWRTIETRMEDQRSGIVALHEKVDIIATDVRDGSLLRAQLTQELSDLQRRVSVIEANVIGRKEMQAELKGIRADMARITQQIERLER